MPSQIALDIDFARQSPEFFGRLTALLRYVVALNPDATKAEFVKEATTRGYNATTAAIQFAQSRRFDVKEYSMELLADGRLREIPRALVYTFVE